MYTILLFCSGAFRLTNFWTQHRLCTGQLVRKRVTLVYGLRFARSRSGYGAHGQLKRLNRSSRYCESQRVKNAENRIPDRQQDSGRMVERCPERPNSRSDGIPVTIKD